MQITDIVQQGGGYLVTASDGRVASIQIAFDSNQLFIDASDLDTDIAAALKSVKVDQLLGALVGSNMVGSIFFGGGTGGVAVFDGINTYSFASLASGVYTLTRDVFLADGSSVAAGITVKTAGYRLFCDGTLTNNGVIQSNGLNGSGLTAGGSSALGSLGIGMAGGAGKANAAGSAGSNQANGLRPTNLGILASGGAGGAGGANAGGSGGTYTSVSAGNGGAHWLFPLYSGYLLGQTSGGNQAQLQIIGGGAGGGGGGSDNAGANGGGGGGGGGVLILHAFALVNNGLIAANGGNGADASGTAGNGGGGGGGGGGQIFQLSRFRSGTGTVTATGGLGGKGFGSGVAGAIGNDGEIHQFNF